jgi:hypothetical protein
MLHYQEGEFSIPYERPSMPSESQAPVFIGPYPLPEVPWSPSLAFWSLLCYEQSHPARGGLLLRSAVFQLKKHCAMWFCVHYFWGYFLGSASPCPL